MKIITLLSLYFISTLCTFGVKASKAEEIEIRNLIEDLVYVETPHELLIDDSLEYAQKLIKEHEQREEEFSKCIKAFNKLTEYKEKSIPFLVKNLHDKRQSISFKNHFMGSSVGDACRWNIHFQLQDLPKNYSSYGLTRVGKDGKNHTKPYWNGSPFGKEGLEKWLEVHKKLSYTEMQIKCLSWILDGEKKIGAASPDSYFRNILPLEIRLLERKLETGAKVERELDTLRKRLKTKDVSIIPKHLLPQ